MKAEIDTLNHLPMKITKREKLWNQCFDWIQRKKEITIHEVSVRSMVCVFIKNTAKGSIYLKVYLPYADTGLGVVAADQISLKWVEIKSLDHFIKWYNKQRR